MKNEKLISGFLLGFFGINGAISIAMSAFARHGALAEDSSELLKIGAEIQIYGTFIGILAILLLPKLGKFSFIASLLSMFGIILFSYTLFAVGIGVFHSTKMAPFGGMALIFSFTTLGIGGIYSAMVNKNDSP